MQRQENGTPSERYGAPSGMSPADVALRAELGRHLPPSRFPANRATLLAHVEASGAPESVARVVARLPDDDRMFRTLGEMVRAAGLHTER